VNSPVARLDAPRSPVRHLHLSARKQAMENQATENITPSSSQLGSNPAQAIASISDTRINQVAKSGFKARARPQLLHQVWISVPATWYRPNCNPFRCLVWSRQRYRESKRGTVTVRPRCPFFLKDHRAGAEYVRDVGPLERGRAWVKKEASAEMIKAMDSMRFEGVIS
jgi:hypothetical protein